MESLDSLDQHLAYRAFMIGHDVTSLDWVLWGALKGAFNSLSAAMSYYSIAP